MQKSSGRLHGFGKGKPHGLQRQRNHSFDTDFADAYKDIG